jgi:putative hydrolase of HD superfamily
MRGATIGGATMRGGRASPDAWRTGAVPDAAFAPLSLRAARTAMPSPSDLAGLLAFLRAAERLKTQYRSAYTSDGRPESVAEHTWRVCLLALVITPMLQAARGADGGAPGEAGDLAPIDLGRLLRLCVVHDLGEAVGGDVPAPEQARRAAAGDVAGKSAAERADLVTLVAPLPPAVQADLLALWDEYEAAATPEARLAKAVDKLETILQHTQGQNPPGFDYRFNLGYGRGHTAQPPLIAALRALLDGETEQRARQADRATEAGRPRGG